MEQKTEKVIKKLNISTDFLKTNVDDLHEEIENQIKFFKSVDAFLQSNKISRRRYLGIMIIITIIYFLILILSDDIYLKIFLGILGFIIVIPIFVAISAISEGIKNKKNLLNSKELRLDFSQETHWSHMKRSEFYKTSSRYNIVSNIGYISKNSDSDFVLFPNFACQYDNSGISIFVGKSLVNKMSHETSIVHESQSYKYKYKKLEYQQWQYQRKDGGPDRRYSNNKLSNYYRYHVMHIGNLTIEIESKKYYDDLRNQWNFDVIRKIPLTKASKQSSNLTNYQENTKPIQQITYNWKDLKSIESYLKKKNILYNNYGETIEFEYNEITYIVDNKGKVRNTSMSVKDIVEVIL